MTCTAAGLKLQLETQKATRCLVWKCAGLLQTTQTVPWSGFQLVAWPKNGEWRQASFWVSLASANGMV